MKENLYSIFKKDNAMQPKEMGFHIEDASTNKRNPNYVIYYFEKTDEFVQAFNKLNDKTK